MDFKQSSRKYFRFSFGIRHFKKSLEKSSDLNPDPLMIDLLTLGSFAYFWRSFSICLATSTASVSSIKKKYEKAIQIQSIIRQYYNHLQKVKNMQGKEKQPKDDKVESFKKVIDAAKQMKDFYEQTYSSTIDLQNRVKGTGFSFLNMDCEELEVEVNRPKAKKIIDRCLSNLRELVPQKILSHVIDFFQNWEDIPKLTFHKKQILFHDNTSSNASFLGAYFRSKGNTVFIAYKFIKSAFKLAKDIYVVTETESESAFFGAFKSSSNTQYLQELNRGFNRQDLKLLMEMATISVFSPEGLKALEGE